ncbi:iron complex transport system substrate-binding protein [Salsuginibacillus halophilus]|uniref:Iron complex transport system substrate-binding protein n=1 Tax=Salsuginibacillus halophilus TaxID=517424 RepID=A0A2P8HE15_9BACI|nr:cobalamin-binding protein [Salsuginibacillus halophilus]PSL44469.1 iron complex transport system substrate-binding protein [Salsuginibacillus halophilus]
MRIISLCPSNTEMVAYLGAERELVGIDDFSDWPESVQNLPRLGPDLSIDMDAVESLQPDLIIASLSVPGMEKNIEELIKRDLPFITLNPQSLDDIANDMLQLGEKLNRKETAQKQAERFQTFIEHYRMIGANVAKNRLYWEWWPKPIFTPGATNWLSYISRLAGGKNIFEDQEQASIQTTWEDVLARDPDHICLAWVGVETKRVQPKVVTKRENAEKAKAVTNNRIHILEEPLYCRPSPRLLLGLKKLAALLHPETFPPNDEKDPLRL